MEEASIWSDPFIQTIAHEAGHVAFRRRTPVGITSRTTDEITIHELSEMYAQFSEFPLHYKSLKTMLAGRDAAEQQKMFQGSMEAWVQIHTESAGEGFQGMLTKIRCLNECDKVPLLIQSLMDSVTAGWPPDMKDTLLRELAAHPTLDWPLPAPNLRPPQDPHPKMPPLYQPRGTFVPEMEKSLEDLP